MSAGPHLIKRGLTSLGLAQLEEYGLQALPKHVDFLEDEDKLNDEGVFPPPHFLPQGEGKYGNGDDIKLAGILSFLPPSVRREVKGPLELLLLLRPFFLTFSFFRRDLN